MHDRSFAEVVCFWTGALTWLFYLFGGLYVVSPVVIWGLGGLSALSLYLGAGLRPELRPAGPVPALAIAWIAGMTAMLVALWVGHLEWNLGLATAIKSSIGWAKGWAMLALLIVAGAVLPIRREILVRGQAIVGLVTLLLLPALLVAPHVGLPEKLFTSPLKAVGGPGPEYFSVYLYTLDPESHSPRWQFYAPWAPFAGMLGVAMVLFAAEDRHRFWRLCGVAGGLAMIFLSASRMGLVALAVCFVVPRLLPAMKRPEAWFLGVVGAVILVVVGDQLLTLLDDSVRSFKEARASSSRVRSLLQQIAWSRWQDEAVWFGHGIVERGPHIVEYMPIGSHHTWYGLLFVKGVVGFAALALPMVWHFVTTAVDAVRSPRGKLPFSIMLLLTILSFGENIEVELYLFWPAVLLLGVHLREMKGDSVAAQTLRARNADTVGSILPDGSRSSPSPCSSD